MTGRAALGSRRVRSGLGALLAAGSALIACGRVDLGSYMETEGASGGAEGGGSAPGTESVWMDGTLDGLIDAEVGEPAGTQAPDDPDGTGGAPNVYGLPQGPEANEGGTAAIGDISTSVQVTGAVDAGTNDAGAVDAGER